MLRLVLISALFSCLLAHAFHSTEVPPLVDVPVWSVASLNEDGSTNANIVTYATPVSIRPERLYSLGLFKQTKTYENFCRERKCVLQLLTAKHIPLVRLLGGKSGNDIDKSAGCAKVSPDFSLQNIDNGGDECTPKVLPSCAYYLKLSAVGDIVDGGESHDIAICKVDEMLLPGDGNDDHVANSEEYLSTAKLRELGIITEQGRIAE